ncbi:uncharacterized protein LOC124912656 [Impatiens glandulifera]|uniref:uncharacterized protein LOC124912656 n=1 Tax=Impatiens glandulifera TaxID=253017 RepID=UPI001FB128CA|nr:uncharacterized protein LOC124912656 [Impatiens glandulifera]
MGSSVSTASNTLGTFLGNAFTAPIKAAFGRSCEGICSGTWDIACFIENLCLSNLVKMVMVFALSFICFVIFYLIMKVGICQCITKGLCKMYWAACQTCWFVYEGMACFLWNKLTSVKRVRRRRRNRHFRDIEMGDSSRSDEFDHSSDYVDDQSIVISRGRKRKEMHKRSMNLRPDRVNRRRRNTNYSRRKATTPLKKRRKL